MTILPGKIVTSGVVLVHGFMQDARAWGGAGPWLRAVAAGDEALARAVGEALDSGRVTVPNLATFLTEPETPPTLPALADGVRKAAEDALGPGPWVVVGYSLGGRVALDLARRFPRQVAALVLEGAGLGPADGRERAALAVRNEAWARRLEGARDAAEAVDWWESLPLFADQAQLPAGVRRAQRAMRCEQDLAWCAALLRGAGAHMMPSRGQALDQLAGVAFPVTYVVGERDAKYRALADLLPRNVRVVTMPGAGHNTHLSFTM